MPAPVVVPRLGWTMEEGIFVEWLKRDGDVIRIGDPIFVLEGEKATQDIEATDAGTLKILDDGPQPGQKVLVGATVGFVLSAGETWTGAPAGSSPTPALTPSPTPASIPAPATASPVLMPSSPPSSPPAGQPALRPTGVSSEVPSTLMKGGRATPPISPRARRVAAELGVDWTTLTGGGTSGRIREDDVRQAAASGSSPAAGAVSASQMAPLAGVAASSMRKTIAERMLASSQQTAPVTLTVRVDATHLVALRKQFRAAAADNEAIPTFNDILVKLCSVALHQHPHVNSRWESDRIVGSEEVHVGIAVDTPQGLIVPVLRSVNRLTLRQVATRSRDLIDRARQRKVAAAELQGGTFTITNLGMFGVDAFTPILNLPQAAILGIGRITREPTVVDDQIVIRDQLTLSLTFDHRIIDGAPAARFLDTISGLIANPAPALIV